ncbi:MAG: mechanosensitive ion channel family protein, partial [Candidatus Hodarchaeota archaeon]
KRQERIIVVKSFKRVITFWVASISLYIAIITFPRDTSSFNEIIWGILLVVLVLSLVIVLARITGGIIAFYSRRSHLPQSVSIYTTLATTLILLLGLLIIFDSLGISITPLLTALGIAGLAVALALQDTLGNFFAGIQILAARQVRIGDYIQLSSGEVGYVEDITWRNTKLRDRFDNMILVPNSVLGSRIITNYYQPRRNMLFRVPLGVSYDSDLKKVREVTLDVAKKVMREVKGGVPEFEPRFRYGEFSDFSINFNVILQCQEFMDQYIIRDQFIESIHERYKQEGITIPFPIRTVYLQGEKQ